MTLPGRTGSSTAYRYGFQGQERDDELKGEGNSLNYTFRMHDPRVGRFFARDPLESKYPHNSPYVFSENRVLDRNELEGLETGPQYWMQHTPAAKQAGMTSKDWERQFIRSQEASEADIAVASGALVKLGLNHYLPKFFIEHYTGLTGDDVYLSDKATIDLHASPVSITGGNYPESYEKEKESFVKEFNSIKKGESKQIRLSVSDKANTQGTMGRFSVIFNGLLTKGKDGKSWSFSGTMQFYDEWDFDSKETGERTDSSESATALGNALLIGKGFKIYGKVYNVTESSDGGMIDWFDDKDSSSIDTKSAAGSAALKAKQVYDWVKDLIIK